MAVSAAAVAKAAAMLLTNEKTRKGLGWILVAIFSPVILLIALLCSLGSGGAEHMLQNFRISFVQLQNHDSSDDITAFPLSLRVAFSRSKVSLLTTCSIRQASRSAVTGSTPAATSISVKKRCFS